MDIVVSEAQGLRLLQFGTPWCQGAMRLDDPVRLELAYAVRMFGWLPFHDPDTVPRLHLATLGLGAGSLTKFAHAVLRMRTTAVEIAPQVIAACREHFALPPDGHGLQVVAADGHAWLAAGPPGRIDVLQVDAYDAAVDAPALDGEAFYADCASALHAQGTLAVNFVGGALDLPRSLAALRAALHPRAVWRFPPTQAGNVVVVAHRGAWPADDVLAARAAAIERRWDLPAREWLAVARRTGG